MASATHLRPQLLGDQAGQPFGQPHPHAADALGAQADGRRQHEVRAIGLEQVDRADVGLEPPLNQVDDVVERLGGVAALRHQPADFFERPEQRVLVGLTRELVMCMSDRTPSKNAAPDARCENAARVRRRMRRPTRTFVSTHSSARQFCPCGAVAAGSPTAAVSASSRTDSQPV